MSSNKSYYELMQLETFEERFRYLQKNQKIGFETFGPDRIFNQKFYSSTEWKHCRNKIILRDNGCDLGHPDHPIYGKIYIHHINPLSMDDMTNPDILLNPDNLICMSLDTHNAIHFSDDRVLEKYTVVERSPNDTCPWKRG